MDLCFDINCENEGICVEGTCDCPLGFIGENCEQVDTSQVQSLLDACISLKVLFDCGVPIEQFYGKRNKGGLIFFFNPDDDSGLVAATEDQSNDAEWGCHGIEIDGADADWIGARAKNSEDILMGCEEVGSAAMICNNLVLNGQVDWFLPSEQELGFMYLFLHMKGYGGFASDIYWSSSEENGFNAWGKDFRDTNWDIDFKSNKAAVCAIRPF